MNSHNKLNKIAVAFLTVYTLSACSQGFAPSVDGIAGGSTNQGSGGAGSVAPIDTIDMKGYSSGGDSEGAMVVDFEKESNMIVLSAPITLSGLGLSINVTHPKYPDIQFYTYMDNKGLSRLAVRVPAKYILRGINLGSPTTLPNGQIIPFLGGELPSTSIDVDISKKSKAFLYIGSGAAALYISHPSIPEYLSVYHSIRNKAGTKVVGSVGVAAKTPLGSGGFVVSVRIPSQFAKIIDDYIGSY